MINQGHISGTLGEKSHRQKLLEDELAKKVHDLSSENGPLLKSSIGILRNYDISIVKIGLDGNRIKFTLKLTITH